MSVQKRAAQLIAKACWFDLLAARAMSDRMPDSHGCIGDAAEPEGFCPTCRHAGEDADAEADGLSARRDKALAQLERLQGLEVPAGVPYQPGLESQAAALEFARRDETAVLRTLRLLGCREYLFLHAFGQGWREIPGIEVDARWLQPGGRVSEW